MYVKFFMLIMTDFHLDNIILFVPCFIWTVIGNAAKNCGQISIYK